jgi:hypothetical protein
MGEGARWLIYIIVIVVIAVVVYVATKGQFILL